MEMSKKFIYGTVLIQKNGFLTKHQFLLKLMLLYSVVKIYWRWFLQLLDKYLLLKLLIIFTVFSLKLYFTYNSHLFHTSLLCKTIDFQKAIWEMCPNLVSILKWYTDCLTEEFSVSVILSHKLKGLQRSELKVWILKLNEVLTINNVYILCFSLLKVCEGLTHFARRSDGTQQSLPIFPGLKGPDISRSLNEVEATFMKNLIILKNVKHTILDVKVSFHLFLCDSIFIICFFYCFVDIWIPIILESW